MDPYNNYGYGYPVPPPMGVPLPGTYVVPTPTYIAPPPQVITPMIPPAYGYPPTQYVQPVIQPQYGYTTQPIINQNAYNYPTGPQIPGINGYSNRSISGHKFQSGFRVKREHYHQF